MYELKKIGKVFTSKSVGTGPSSYEKRIYRAVVSQRLTNTGLYGHLMQFSGYQRVRCVLAAGLVLSWLSPESVLLVSGDFWRSL